MSEHSSEVDRWNKRYRAAADSAGAEPEPLVVRIASQLQPGRALDLACGAGRNSIWLAEHGWNVTAVDASRAALDLVRHRSREIEIREADLEAGDYRIEPAAWDLILVINYLQRDLFRPIQEGLKPGGVAIAVVHLAVEDPAHPQSRFSLKPGELAAYFEGCEVLYSYEGPRQGSGRAVAELAARRS